MLYIPKRMLSKAERQLLRNTLTLKFDQGASSPDAISKIVEVKSYDLSVPEYLGIPRYFGTAYFPKMEYEDRSVEGNNVKFAFNGLRPIKPRTDQQRDYFREIANICKPRDEFTDYIAVAGTGTGKTVAAINTAIVAKKPMLVVVHTNRLKEQWLGSVKMKNGLRFFLGEEFVDNHVGIIQQGTCNYRNKAICIAMIHSLASRDYPEEFYKHFYSVHFDELHKHTAPHFAKCIGMFPQRVRGGMTATMRDDILRNIAHWHFGPVRVTSKQEVMKSKVYMCNWRVNLPSKRINTYSKGTILTSLTELPERNELIAKIAYRRGYLRDRQVLVVSDRVHQLQDIRSRMIEMGANKHKLGLYVGRVYTNQFSCTVIYRKEKKRIREKLYPLDAQFFSNQYVARKAAREFLKENRINSYDVIDLKIEEDFYSPKDAWFKRLEQKCSVFFATYGIFDTGNDIARLDLGVEASPRTDQRQVLGRILRQDENKELPEWYSIVDEITLETPNEEPLLLEDLLKASVNRRRSFLQQDAKIVRVRDLAAMFS